MTSREVKSGPVWRKNTPHDAPPTQRFCFDRFHHIFFFLKSLIFSQKCQKKKKVFSRIKIFREYVAVGCGFRRFLNRKETNPGPFFFSFLLYTLTHIRLDVYFEKFRRNNTSWRGHTLGTISGNIHIILIDPREGNTRTHKTQKRISTPA